MPSWRVLADGIVWESHENKAVTHITADEMTVSPSGVLVFVKDGRIVESFEVRAWKHVKMDEDESGKK